MKNGVIVFGVISCIVCFLIGIITGMNVGLSKGLKECEQTMRLNECPCFPVGEEGWHYIHCDCCDGYVWHNPNEDQEININLKGEKSIDKLKGE